MKTSKKVEELDFRKVQRLLKSQIEPLQGIFENFSRLAGLYLSTELRCQVNSKFLSLQEEKYTEFINTLQNPTVIGVLRLPPFDREMFIEINPTLSYIIIERMLGAGSFTEAQTRTFTEIELKLIERIIKKLIDLLAECFRNLFPEIKSGEFQRLEFNPLVLRLCQDNESIISALAQISVTGGKETTISFCMPTVNIENLLIKLYSQDKQASKFIQSPQDKQKMKQNLDYLELPVIVELGRTTITVEQLLQLQKGDVLKLDTKSSQPLIIKLTDVAKFEAVPGIYGKRLAVSITKIL